MTPLPIIAGLFVLGLIAGPFGSAWLLALVTGGLLGLGAWLGRRRGLLGALSLMAAAFVLGALRAGEIETGVPRPRLARQSLLLTGRVVSGCTPDGERTRCLLARPDGSRVVLYAPTARCRAWPGEHIAAVATLRPLAPDANGPRAGPGAGALRRGVVATAAAAGCERTAGARADALDLARRAGLWLRTTLAAGLSRALPEAAARKARALLFGDGRALESADVEAFRESGLAHLLAVSGAHVALLAALLAGLAGALARRLAWVAVRGQVGALSALVSLPPLVLFVLATGESPSAVRALLGALLGALAAAAGRTAHAEAVVAASAVVTAAVAPALVRDPGWQLSIVAAGALAARRPNEPHAAAAAAPPSLARAVLSFWRDALFASVRVAVAAAPVLAWHFQRAPLAAVAANALAAPLAEALALPLVLAAGLLGALVPTAGALAGCLAAPVLDAMFAMPRVALALPAATAAVPPPTPGQACALVVLALLALRLGWRGRAATALGAVLVTAGLELCHLRAAHPRGVLRVTALDVGQGDAILVDLPDGAAMLVDGGGGRPDGPDPGARVVVPWLADQRRTRLAAVVASHPHPDHVGGLAAVLRWARVDELWDTRQGERFTQGGSYARLRAAARARAVPVRGPEALCGPPRRFHGATIEVLAPCPAPAPDAAPNDASFVIRLTYGRASVLLPGDLERAGEAAVRRRLGPVTLLKVGHHGSRTSSTGPFLDAVRPAVALVSAGHPSPFDHPHPEVLARLGRRGIAVFSTAAHGATAVTLRADGSYAVAWGPSLAGLR